MKEETTVIVQEPGAGMIFNSGEKKRRKQNGSEDMPGFAQGDISLEERFEKMLDGAARSFAFIGCAVPEEGVIAGPEKLQHVLMGPYAFRQDLRMGDDNSHYPLNYEYVLHAGLPEMIARAKRGLAKADTEEKRLRLNAVISYLRMYKSFIGAHASLADALSASRPEKKAHYDRIAANCRALTEGAPQTFEQAVQLFYFTWRMRSNNYTSTIGRLDMQLREAYKKSVAEGMTEAEAHDIICELIVKLNKMGSGDTLMNMMLGGVDAEGNDATDDLSILILQCCNEMGMPEPHVNVRYHNGTPERFKREVEKVVARGQGQPTLYIDENIIPGLLKLGYPIEIARCYANDGCTEVTFEGNAGIFFWQMESMKSLELAIYNGEESPNAPNVPIRKWKKDSQPRLFKSALTFGYESGDVRRCETFEDFMACFHRQFDYQVRLQCEGIAEKILLLKQTDEFQSALNVQSFHPNVLDTGLELVRGGYATNNFQLLSGSLPTVADCLYAVKEAVYDRKICTMAQLIEAMDADFKGYELLQKQLKAMKKFGNDEDDVDLLAADLAQRFCETVENYPFPCGVRVLPGIYNIDFQAFSAMLGASPDGRNAGDAICCHYSPTPGCATKGITAAFSSAAKGKLYRGVASSPVYLVLPRLLDVDYAKIVSPLLEGCRSLGLPVINLSVVNVEELEDARIHPENHRDLVVRVWGYNAYFNDLDEKMQLHVINRALHS